MEQPNLDEILDPRQLAEAVLRYEDLHDQMKALEERIVKSAMFNQQSLELSRTQVKYSEGRKSYDWEGFLQEIKPSLDEEELENAVRKHSKVKVSETISWSEIAKELGMTQSMLVEAGFMRKGEPSVKISVK